jgi:hypothetical protein
MLARLHHYEELRDHIAFFKRAFGMGWSTELVQRGATNSTGELPAILKQERSFTRVVLPRLRALRLDVEQASPGHNLAKPPLTRDAHQSVAAPSFAQR